uniref:Retinoic acid receptor responder protein 2 n=1 Tax=Mastacembelus armatus TaxID=205130 RepID=A0A3Q3S142_9TELE
MATGLLLLFCAGVVLWSAKAQEPFNALTNNYKKGVELAFEQLNSHAAVQHHFLFLRSLEKSEIEGGFGVAYFYHHFLLKPTVCAKRRNESSPEKCPFRNDRPLMDCAICYKMAAGQIETSPKPYVHCIQRPRLTETMRKNRVEHCKRMSYNSGAPTLLAVSSG